MSRLIGKDIGVRLCGAPMAPTVGPLRDGPDVSWINRCRVGDDQGVTSACSLFGHANWAEIMHGEAVTDEACTSAYRLACQRYDVPDGSGLTVPQAFQIAHELDWLPGAREVRRVDSLAPLVRQPLLGCYALPREFSAVDAGGFFAMPGLFIEAGYHLMAIVGHGKVNAFGERTFVYVENSWGLSWGYNGMCFMEEATHRAMIREIWSIET